MAGQGSGRRHHVLLGAWRQRNAMPALLPQNGRAFVALHRMPRRLDMHIAIHVHDQPQIGRGIQFELLDHQAAGARDRFPMNTIVTIARLIVAHPRDIGRHVVGAPAHGVAAGQDTDRRIEGRKVHRDGVDDDGRCGWQGAAEAEQPQRIAAGQGQRAKHEAAALLANRAHNPALAALAPQGTDDMAGVVRR